MKLTITIKPNARHELVEKIDEHDYRVAVKSPAVEGKANAALIKALAKHFSVPQSSVHIKLGLNSRKKLVEIDVG